MSTIPKGRESTARTPKATQVEIRSKGGYSIGGLKKKIEPVQVYAGTELPQTSLRGVLLNMKQGGLVYVFGGTHTVTDPFGVDVKKASSKATLEFKATLKRLQDEQAQDSAQEPELSVDDAGPLELHHKVLEGIATKSLLDMLERFDAIPKQELLTALGVSERTLQRHRDGRLGSDLASVALDLAAITEQAQSVLGSMAEAQRWLTTGAVALKGQRPLDLLSTRQGADLVRDLLVRMEYGVYA